MSTYVDGYVLPIKRDVLDAYRAIAAQAGALWKEHGALKYFEAVGDDVDVKDQLPFPKLAGAGPDEIIIFAYVVFESREHRDAVNARVMADPRIHAMCDPGKPLFDCQRMAYGGFKSIVEV